MSDYGIQLIDLKMGMKIVIPPDHAMPIYPLFCVTTFASAFFDGNLS
ncbi:hypothetical protein JW897_06905 [Chromobacterium alkanivorans]|nr:hypothetical protein [Chromobacterium alkanivorans]MBN3003463.1 hypothetical protein [Chromobacterium alkanivorans]